MKKDSLDAGQDSFLDIIANLVGVLIILVVIVGAQATSSVMTMAESKVVIAEDESNFDAEFEKRKAELGQQLSQLDSEVAKLMFDRANLEKQTNDEKLLAQKLATRRHAMLKTLEIVREKHKTEKQELLGQLDAREKEQLELEAEKIRLVSRLESIEKEINAVSVTNIESVVETIDHYPNPIAKTVFSNEVHFRLKGGKIAYVPMDELVDQMKSEVRLKAEKLKEANVTRETVGPVDGFRLQYELGIVPPEETGVPGSRIVRFKRFIIQPDDATAGERVANAVNANSLFSRKLGQMEPRRTTVSIWVYPDSYAEHSILKMWLHDRGYQMASWPLADGRPISGGPDGFRTSAQ